MPSRFCSVVLSDRCLNGFYEGTGGALENVSGNFLAIKFLLGMLKNVK